MSLGKIFPQMRKQIEDESKQIKSDSAKDRDTMLAHSAEFQERFYAAKSEIEEKRKAIQKIMR